MLLRKGINFEERDIFKDPFSETEIMELAGEIPLSELFSWRSPVFKAMGPKGESLDAKELIRLMATEPRLIRRPVVHMGNKWIVGNVKAVEKALDI